MENIKNKNINSIIIKRKQNPFDAVFTQVPMAIIENSNIKLVDKMVLITLNSNKNNFKTNKKYLYCKKLGINAKTFDASVERLAKLGYLKIIKNHTQPMSFQETPKVFWEFHVDIWKDFDISKLSAKEIENTCSVKGAKNYKNELSRQTKLSLDKFF